MRKDFHFSAIYALSRTAGFRPDDAYTVAYASQYTDDAVSETKLEFENGGEFEPILTAHRLIDPLAISERTCSLVWTPFHFLPGNEGGSLDEKMITRKDSVLAQKIITQFLETPVLPYTLHLLGIILHVYADTWSHQNFMGRKHRFNQISNLIVSEKSEIAQKVISVGHAQAWSYPDEPFRNWEYTDYDNKDCSINNVVRALEAAEKCHQFLVKFLDGHGKDFFYKPPIPWETIKDKINSLFEYKGYDEACCKFWHAAISNGELGFKAEPEDKNLTYDHLSWFYDAVDLVDINLGELIEKIGYEKKADFEKSHWKYFYDAAAYYRSTLFRQACKDFNLYIPYFS